MISQLSVNGSPLFFPHMALGISNLGSKVDGGEINSYKAAVFEADQIKSELVSNGLG